ncbi:glycosyltransferase family 2 protein [Yoonia sp. 2307UL14-13]|uniref:glycosyltransferase family 2 protein n=1 Tax=Yoonia sp. 2307UL14-13 TaxID=3126506 RepID=UPI00309965B2
MQLISTDNKAAGEGGPQDPLSRGLLQGAHISYDMACAAEHDAGKRGVSLADIYCRRFGVSQLSIATILAEQAGAQRIDPTCQPPDIALIRRFGAQHCLRTGLMPWRQIGGTTIILTTRPEKFVNFEPELQACFGRHRMALTTEEQLIRTINALCGPTLVDKAEARTAPTESCRSWNHRRAAFVGAIVVALSAVTMWQAPAALFGALALWTILILACDTALKATIIWMSLRKPPPQQHDVTPVRLPVITMLVPLYNETAIADHLLTRLKALDYPRELLDVIIVLESDDVTTRTTLGRTILPTWMRPVVVPKGTIKTKPRAMNYALDFARGSIIGIWDAEDAPAPDQLHKVAHHFANAGPQTACLQGTLDYYNSRVNWLTRCFSLEYATWFRVVLPGLQRLGLVIPLGGTTLFFRRDVLEKLGGWDAHNVTEDADLGVRLARHGYRTALIDTTTEEEANGRTWPWIKQRSRWLKGYAITYGVHMRNPYKLWRDLGAWRFWGLQLLLLGTLSQFLLAPLLWSFWIIPFGVQHPLGNMVPKGIFWAIVGLFVVSELVRFACAAIGARKAGKSWLIPWALSLQFYFPLAAIAAYKGIYELAARPFYWDKTAHGVLLPKGWRNHSAASTAAASSFRRVTNASEM